MTARRRKRKRCAPFEAVWAHCVSRRAGLPVSWVPPGGCVAPSRRERAGFMDANPGMAAEPGPGPVALFGYDRRSPGSPPDGTPRS